MKPCTVCLVLASLLAPQSPVDPVRQALTDYRAGRYQDAFVALQSECAQRGAAVPDELRFNLALAALRVQRSSDAEAAVAPWLELPAGARRAEAEFLTAMAAFQRAERAALAAQLPDAEPTAWTMAVAAMDRAIAGFARADEFQSPWPEAQRNRARAEQRRRELQAARDRAQSATKQEPTPTPAPAPVRPPEPATTEAATPDAVTEPLLPHEVALLRQRLQQKDKQKRTLRQEAQRSAVAAGARGW
jgi:hypothetical protein